MLTTITRLPRWVLAVVLAAVLLHAAVGVMLFRLQRPEHRITGNLTLVGSIGSGEQGCEGSGGYDDISEGTQVTVSDGSGKTIALGSLRAGRQVDRFRCTLDFSIAGVPDADFYKVEVAHRGALTFSKQELASKGWQVEATLG
jgi:hypothetical protein